MTFQELQERGKGRNFDRIVVVVKDIFDEISELQRVTDVTPHDVRICDQNNAPGLKNDQGELNYTQRQASYFYENTELCVVQPVKGDTIYQRFLDRFGEGLCCVRERVSEEMFAQMEAKFVEKNLKIAQRQESADCKALWLDLMDELGIVFELTTEDSAKVEPTSRIPQRIAQVNITTPNVKDTITRLVDYLEIGPWEVGAQATECTHDTGFLQADGSFKDEEFKFLLAIIPCGNIEWEVIEPVKGSLCVYRDYLERRGVGFHHILKEVPMAQWDQMIKSFDDKGIKMACKGGLGPISWCYYHTENQIHFHSEFRDDAVMDKLPDGYVQYFYPEQA